MKQHTNLVIFFFLCSFALFSNEINEVILNGNVVVTQNFGPPTYGERPEIDKKEMSYILCLDEKKEFVVHGEKIRTDKLQLLFYKPKNRNITFDANKKYEFRGSIEPAQTGHHYTDYIFIVSDFNMK